MAVPAASRAGGGLQPIDKRQALAGHFLFRHLSEAEVDGLLTRARVQRHKAGAVIFRQGDPGHGLVAVLSGEVKITSPSVSGKEIVLNIINPGEVFGEIALLDGKARSADAVAIAACELLVIDRRDFVPFLEARPALCIRLLAVLCERLRKTSEQVQDLLFLDLRARLAKTLLRLGEAHGQAAPGGREISLKLSQRELGNLVGRSRESVNKQLREWQDAKLIRFQAGRLIIRDVAALERQSEPE
ncbi:MAG TPA: Crp/Fnr family transcriptional regulator [Alphaproteobacteria bacterium]